MPIIAPFKTDIPRYPCRVMHQSTNSKQDWYQNIITELVDLESVTFAINQLRIVHSFDDIEIMYLAISLAERLKEKIRDIHLDYLASDSYKDYCNDK